MTEPRPWTTQSAVTDPGKFEATVDDLPSAAADLKRISEQLVFHYRASGDWATHGVTPERISEIDTRDVQSMLGRLLELNPQLAGDRAQNERIVGCCRDFTVLFVSMARQKGLPARARVGFATYILEDWYIDHVVAEVWDPAEDRWRLIEAQIPDGFVPQDGPAFDMLDVPRDRFLTGPKAWLEARAGVRDAERFVVWPDLGIPITRGWLYLRHNLIHDLAALAKREMVLWDQWGVMEDPWPEDESSLQAHRELETLDHLARLIADPMCPSENIEDWAEKEGFRVPDVVKSYSAAAAEPLQVDVSRLIGRGVDEQRPYGQ